MSDKLINAVSKDPEFDKIDGKSGAIYVTLEDVEELKRTSENAREILLYKNVCGLLYLVKMKTIQNFH